MIKNWKFWKRTKQVTNSTAMISGMGETLWTPKDYENYARETYMKNVVAFRCIDIIAKSVAQVPWKLFEKKADGQDVEILTHYINALLNRPNPEMSFPVFQYNVMSYLSMAGNSFIQRIGISDNTIRELWTLQPDRMKIKVDKNTGLKQGFIYCYNGTEYFFPIDAITGKCEILHLKTFNPIDENWGMASTEPAAYEIDTANSSIKWNKKLTDNEARPGMLLMFEHGLTDEQYNRLKSTMDKDREGAENAGKTLILEGARDVKPYGFSPKEMDWIQSNLELARRICNAWGVPGQMMGIPDTTTYSNYKEARSAFWEDTVIFFLEMLKNEYNYWLLGNDTNLYLKYILNDVPAMQYKRDMQWARAQTSDFLTINEKRKMTENESIADGDVLLISAAMIPLGTGTETGAAVDNATGKAIDNLMKVGFSKNEAQDIIND